MVKRALKLGIRADYILMDSWFCFPSLLAALGESLSVICMAKDMPRIFYRYNEQWMRLSKLCGQLRKRPGKAKVLAGVVAETTKGQKVNIVFVRNRQKKCQWLAIVSTRVDLADEEVARVYGKRGEIEAFFKMMKRCLNLEREAPLRDDDGMIGHTTIAMCRYLFLVFEQRCHDDPRTLGTLFFACGDEMKNMSLVEALQRLLSLVMEKIRSAGVVAEDKRLALVDTIMSVAIDWVQTGQRLFQSNNAITAN
jgi:hypothetical protein